MKGKLIGEIYGIKVFSNKKVPKNEVWFEDSNRPNPVYSCGFLDVIAFAEKTCFVNGKNMFNKLKNLVNK